MSIKFFIKYFVVILLITILTNSCNESKTTNKSIQLEKLYVDPSLAQSISLDSIYLDENIIRLATADSILVDMVFDFQITDKRFYILTFNHRIFSFSENGSVIYKIDKQGKGPAEYISPTCLYADPNDQYLEIFNRGSKNVVVLDSIGNYLYDWKYDLYISKATQYENLTCMLVGSVLNFIDDEECTKQLFIYDSLHNLQKSYISFDKRYWEFLGVGDRIDLVQVNKDLHIRLLYNDTVYCLSKNKEKTELYPKYLFDFGKDAIPPEVFHKEYEDVTDLRRELKREGCIYDVYRYLETDEHIFFSFKRKKITYLYFYSKKTKQVKIIDKVIIPFKGFVYQKKLEYNDLPWVVKNNYFYFIKEPVDYIDELESIKKHLDSKKWEKFKEENREYYEFVSSLSIMDNPIIIKRRINPNMFN